MAKLTDAQDFKRYLQSLDLKPRDYLGQNFLIDERVLNEIIAAGEIKRSDAILEVGPGLGVLTRELAIKAGEVIAVEKDKNLIPILKEELKKFNNVKIINQDILHFDFQKYFLLSYKIIANIPYYLTSKLIADFLTANHKPNLIVLLVQKEVGQRIVAKAGELSILGISVQLYSDPEIVTNVPKTSFWPMPKVDSCVIKLKIRNKYPQILNEKLFFQILKMTFCGKRKQIHNTLAAGLRLNKNEINDLLRKSQIDPQARPQDLTIEQWIKLYLTLQSQIFSKKQS